MKTFLVICLSIICSPLAAQYEDVTIRTTHVSGVVYMLEGKGGNLAVSVGDDGVLLVDDQYAPLAEKILAAIRELSPEPVRFVLNTHWHFDHTGGNEILGSAGSVIVAHDNVRQRMSTDQFLAGVNLHVPASPDMALPVITFSDQVTFHFNGEAITAFYVAEAHTDGDSIVHFPASNVIHMGDNFFNGMYPFIDVDNGGSVKGMIDSVQIALGYCDTETKVIPGHGPLANCADLESYGQMLADATERIEKLIGQGKGLRDIKELRPNSDMDKKLGEGFIKPERFIEFIYSSLVTDGY